MEKSRELSLHAYFTRSLLLAVLGVLGIAAAVLGLFMFSIQAGLVYPANAGETQARAEMNHQRETGQFTAGLQPVLYDYVYFDAGGNVVESSLPPSKAAQSAALYPDKAVAYTTAAYLVHQNGASSLFIWNYKVVFANTLLRRLLPSVELLMIVVGICLELVFFVAYVGRISRNLACRLALVQTASDQIGEQNLDTPIATNVGIREFSQVLRSMENMRQALKASLTRQWKAQQQRKQEIGALAHDLKTPLTIINGNAELLLEEPLDTEQAKLAASIHAAGSRAQQYVSALQQVSSLETMEEAASKTAVDGLLHELQTALLPMAKAKGVSLILGELPHFSPIKARPLALSRGLINIGENAIRFTPAGGQVKVSATQTENTTTFAIEDEGPGFSPEALAHASEMFWQQDKSRTATGSYGMGLAIAAKVAGGHKGKLLLDNTPAGGRVQLVVANEVQ